MRKRECCKCGLPNDRLPQRYCRSCHAQNMRETRPRHSELSAEARKRANARSYANVYQRRGKLAVEHCAVCGAPAQKHHPDYDRPLHVQWFCRKHHLDIHS